MVLTNIWVSLQRKLHPIIYEGPYHGMEADSDCHRVWEYVEQGKFRPFLMNYKTG